MGDEKENEKEKILEEGEDKELSAMKENEGRRRKEEESGRGMRSTRGDE